MSDPTFHVSMGDLGEEASPYNCFIECLRQNIILPGKPLTIGLSQGGICLCGHENSKNLKNLIAYNSAFLQTRNLHLMVWI